MMNIKKRITLFNERIVRVKQSNIENQSIKILFKEFNRRLSILYLNSNQKFPINLFFFIVDIEEKDRKGEDFSGMIPQGILDKFGKGIYDLIVAYFCWLNNRNQLSYYIEGEEDRDLFYPIIRIIERGGYIHKEGKIFMIDGESFKIELDIKPPYLNDFSDFFLDNL